MIDKPRSSCLEIHLWAQLRCFRCSYEQVQHPPLGCRHVVALPLLVFFFISRSGGGGGGVGRSGVVAAEEERDGVVVVAAGAEELLS